jgi:hypothetical protein
MKKIKSLKYLKIIFLLLISIQLMNLYADEPKKKLRELEVSNVLLENPSFKLKIRKSGAPLVVHLNGVQVFEELSTDQTGLYYPVNDFMTSGENIISFNLMAFDNMDFQLGKDTYANVSLLLEGSSGEDQVISILSYDNRQKNKLSSTSSAGRYSSLDRFKARNNGDVLIGELLSQPMKYYLSNKVSGINLEHTVNLQTPFPRWRFLDSDLIMEEEFDYNEISNQEYQELKATPLIQSLYDVYFNIQNALEQKDISSIIDLFDERNQELEIALDLETGYVKNSLSTELLESIAKDKLVVSTRNQRDFYIEKGNRLAYIDPIAFNKPSGGSSKYNMKFRLKNGKWILTR